MIFTSLAIRLFMFYLMQFTHLPASPFRSLKATDHFKGHIFLTFSLENL